MVFQDGGEGVSQLRVGEDVPVVIVSGEFDAVTLGILLQVLGGTGERVNRGSINKNVWVGGEWY